MFFEAAFKKRKKRNPKFEVSDFADFSAWNLQLPVELRQRDIRLERVQATTEDVFVSLRLGAL